jgi:hypothetical protein
MTPTAASACSAIRLGIPTTERQFRIALSGSTLDARRAGT